MSELNQRIELIRKGLSKSEIDCYFKNKCSFKDLFIWENENEIIKE